MRRFASHTAYLVRAMLPWRVVALVAAMAAARRRARLHLYITGTTLGGLVQQAEDLLAELLAQGFVEALPEAVAPPPPAPPVRPAVPAPAAAPAAAPSAATSGDFDTLRRNAVRALNDALGPAAESLAIRIERARSMAELRPLLVQAAQLMANMRGRGAAEAYAAKFLASE